MINKDDPAYLPYHVIESVTMAVVQCGPLDFADAALEEKDETPPSTPAPAPDRPELSKADYILSQKNSNPGQ